MSEKEKSLNTIKSKKILTTLAIILSAGVMSACGKKGAFVGGVNVVLQEKNGEDWIGINTTLNTGKATLPTMTIPIYDKKHERELIHIEIGNTGGAKPKSMIGFTTNLSKLEDLPRCTGDSTLLPNGSSIPLVDTEKEIYCVPIGKETGRIYIGAHSDTQELAIGIALTIKEFQYVGKKLGKIDLFLPFEFQNLEGVYGFFTGKEKAQSGLGLFFDLSQYLSGQTGSKVGSKSLLTSKELEKTTAKEQNLLKGLIELQNESRTLDLH